MLMCVFSITIFSFVFPEPSLTTENLSTVLDGMEDRLWDVFSGYVNMRQSEVMRIRGQYSSDRECKQAVIHSLISTHPALSWILLAHFLYQMGVHDYGGSCHKALDRLQQLFPTGTNNMHECILQCRDRPA